MKLFCALVIAGLMAGCTNLGQVQEDLGAARDVGKRAGARLADSIDWRDMEIWQVQRERSEALRVEARALAAGGDLDGAEALWKRAEDALRGYQPVLEKLTNVKAVKDELGEGKAAD